jgi:NTP pyrophosphatase (non-canonical NTP hydrolase)
MIDLNGLAEQTAQNSIRRGFTDGQRPTPVEAMAFVALIMTELAEVVEVLRLGCFTVEYNTDRHGKPVGIENELADIILRTLDLSKAYGLNLEEALQKKADYNDKRPMGYGGRVR